MKVKSVDLKKYVPDFLKSYNQFVVLTWKLGLGKLFNSLPSLFGRTMVIGRQERGSNGSRFMPVTYFTQDDSIYCTMLFNQDTNWYLNVVANPQVEIWLPDGWYAGSAEVVEGEERSELLRKLLVSSGRITPLVLGIDPLTAEEDVFDEVTASYRLLRISRQSPRTGADGPGSLAWLWPLAFLLLLFGRKNRK
jgi:hypothetical protein